MAPKKLSSKSKDVDVGASVAAPSAADLDPISTNERILQRVQQIYQKDGIELNFIISAILTIIT